MGEVEPQIPKRSRRPLKVAAVSVTGLLIGGLLVAVIMQQRQIDDLRGGQANTTKARCEEARLVVKRSLAEKPEPNYRKAANAALQNPDCFNADDRAIAQTWLDQLNAE